MQANPALEIPAGECHIPSGPQAIGPASSGNSRRSRPRLLSSPSPPRPPNHRFWSVGQNHSGSHTTTRSPARGFSGRGSDGGGSGGKFLGGGGVQEG